MVVLVSRFTRFVALMIVLGTAVPGWSAVIYVRKAGNDGNNGLSWATAKLTVQAGLNAASSGGEVWVASGTYVERITLKDGVGLYGGFAGTETQRDQRNWATNVTILDGNAGGSVVTSPSGATGTTAIDGFTVRNGNSVDFGPGGGIYCYDSSPTITNNTITGNSSSDGGGIYCQASSPTITNNRIMGNSVGFGRPGGGVFCSGSSPVIRNNTITGNSAPYGPGGGIYCVFSSPTIENNTISANSADGGGGIYCDNPSPTITNNTISGNTARNLGGGISCTGSSPTISNNTITGNSAGAGGGIHCDYDSSPTITNNTISGNNVTSNGGGINCNLSSPAISNNIVAFNSSGISNTAGTPTLRNNDVYANNGNDYDGLSAGVGDISQDPLFVNLAGGNYHLAVSSPCINAGWNDAPGITALDMDGQPRKVGVIDIGADEYWAPPATTIHGAKLAPDGWPVDIDGAIVSAVWTDYFYIESDDRACGIRVMKFGHSLEAGMRAHVIGFAQTVFGEKCIGGASTVAPAGSGSVDPLGMPIKSLGGGNMLNPFVGLGQQGVMGGTGMNNIGLLVRLWGQVTEVEPGLARWFKIDDGSGREIKCMAEDGSPVISPSWQGRYAVVTGLSSCEIAGGNLVSMIRLKRDSIPLIY